MRPFSRRKPDPGIEAAREAFRAIAAQLDAAQRTLLAAVPTARSTGTPLPQALDDFIDRLARIAERMPAWRSGSTALIWSRCSEALVQAKDNAVRIRSDTSALDFVALNARLGDVISPLEEFADAAGRIKRLR